MSTRRLFMVIERFKNRDPRPIYARVAEKGRMMPEGLTYVSSWVEHNFDRCFQMMECDDEGQLRAWIEGWKDLVDFEIVPVRTSTEARELALGTSS